MKKNIIAALSAASALLLCASCQKQELVEQNNGIDASGKTFTATIEQSLTKTTITSEYKVNWVEGDQIDIDGSIFSATPDASDATKATFTKVSGSDPTPDYTAVYPASIMVGTQATLPATQTYAAGRFNAPMCAMSSTDTLEFKNFCGVLCFALKGTDKVKSIAVTANEQLCGPFEFADATSISFTGENEGYTVTLDCGEGVQLSSTDSTNFYVYLPPKDSYTAGMKIVVTSTEGKTFEKTTKTAVKIERNNLYTFDWTASFGPTEPDCVEIGGLKWATKNLGAEKETDYGDYFAWGETAPYYEGTGGWPATPTWKSGKESGYVMQSYCGSSDFNEWSTLPYDATTKILKPEFDAATQILGNGWRMPTSAEFKALYDACGGSFDKTTNPGKDTSVGKGIYWCTNYDGVAGCLFCDGTNKLFFPAAGSGHETSLTYADSHCNYWSSSLGSETWQAFYLYFQAKMHSPTTSTRRSEGYSVRPVKAAAAPLPADALSGEFSVSATKKVHFSKGNLTYNVSTTTWAFYEHQYDCATGYDSKLISLFTWGYDATKSIVPDGTNYVEGHTTDGEPFSNTEDWGYVFGGESSVWRTLSKDDWTYLFNTRTMTNGKDRYSNALTGVTIGGATYKGVFLYPDNYNGEVVSNSMTWDAINAAGIVFLPAAGCRYGSDVSDVDVTGLYWSSTAYRSGDAYNVRFSGSTITPGYDDYRDNGSSVRLVTDASATPDPTPTTTGTAKRTGDIDVNWVQLWENGPKFAEYNIGADKATDYGHYLAWGGSSDKDATYNAGSADLSGSDDSAYKVWGKHWRMPTKAELEALLSSCDVEWMDGSTKKYNNTTVKGLLCKGKGAYASNSVFLPAAGYNDGNVSGQGSIGYYWSSTPGGDDAYGLGIHSGSQLVDYCSRDNGLSVRPIYVEDLVAVTGVSLNKTTLKFGIGDTETLSATVAPANATNKKVLWTSSDKKVATVDAYGKVTGVKTGECVITATTEDGGKTATCTVTVTAPVTTFKAVYNTNGDANTLTFYYDANDHSGDSITVYEDGTDKFLFDDTKISGAKWGYNDKRGEIKSVVIDASVAGYKGLTSTAAMFQGMAKATNISGAEYLDVSNVTDMNYMFSNFGGGTSGSPTTLNVVPDVSKWNTSNVKYMNGMFESYGNFSSSLDKVPDVSDWNTGNVINMDYMFQKYGYGSQTFNAVPDVSKWNTGNVTTMKNMFFGYGFKSTALNAVPDVSNWNTGNVTNMFQMFISYGNSSTALNTVPNVSNWNTGNVTNMENLFYGYGHTSTNISCVLDLSGWNLANVTSGEGVFGFYQIKTFSVTIPAKTGVKANDASHWYYGDGTNHIAPPKGKTFTPTIAGALKGVFSVSATKKVYFSKGNLQATYNSSASTYTWGFAANQYSYIGDAAGNTTIGTQTDGAVVDLFGWSTASTTYGISKSFTSSDYSGDFVDWGKAYCEKNSIAEGTWRTLTNDEWKYLFKNHSKKWATVNGVKGYVIAPDGFAGTLSVTYADDAALAANNLVFLPAAGRRLNLGATDVNDYGNYWSSTANGDSAYRETFNIVIPPGSGSFDRFYGLSVRLVTDVK